MHKHHKFSTGLVISGLIALIIICIGIFSRLMFRDRTEAKKTYMVALITDSSDINDNSFNQYAYEGIKDYCDEENISYRYYCPEDTSSSILLASVDEAVKDGAKLIVCADSVLNETVYQAQERYSDVNFILVDSEPANNDGTITETGDNVTALLFDDDETGFLAGYCAVKCGYNSLSVIYNATDYSELHYYYGFAQGADYAAGQNNTRISLDGMNIQYAKKDYPARFLKEAGNSGTDVIFVCNSDVCESLNDYAVSQGMMLMNVGINMSDSQAVAGSVIKNIRNAVYISVKSYFSGNFKGGDSITFNSSNDGISFIPNPNSISSFSESDYAAIYEMLASDSIDIISDTTVNLEDMGLKNTTYNDVSPKG